MGSIEQALQQGISVHSKGDLVEAERLYKAILDLQPEHPEANHNLGLIAVSRNQLAVALPMFKSAVKANPNIEQFWISYIDLLIVERQFESAKKALKKGKKKGVAKEKINALTQKLMSVKAGSSKEQSPPQTEIRRLLDHYRSGLFSHAEELAASIITKFPDHQLSWKVMGASLQQTERQTDALKANQKSVQLSKGDPEAHNNLGISWHKIGKLEEAEVSFRQAIALKFEHAGAHSNLGNLLKEMGRLGEAEESYKRALITKPNYAEAHYNLGVTLQELGRLREAEASYKQAIKANANYAKAHGNLGIILNELGKTEEAEASYRRAIALKSDFSEAHNNLGNALKEQGRLEEAEASYRQAISLESDYAEAHSNLGNTLQELGKLDAAEASLRQSITLEPNSSESHSNLGAILQQGGNLEEAEACYRQSVALNPECAEAHRHLASMKKFNLRDEQYMQMREIYFDENARADQRCQVNFGLAKASEDLGDFEQAFFHYKEGNALRKSFLNYDISQDIELFTQLKSSLPIISQNPVIPDAFQNRPKPIFIVGMPRSGTTLVEQIISSHSDVMGAGELPFVEQFGASVVTDFSEINTDSLLKFRELYVTKLQHISAGSPIVTDKMPLNFRYIGLLAVAFPEAKIVHVKRNPAALCWANYKQYFVSEALGYCYELEDVLNYYELYINLMAFWQESFSNRIYDVDYDLLTINQEDETRKLIQYLDLSWDEKCLSPQENKRRVATASNMQVREKVYQGSSQQWKKYKPFLNGVLDYLDI